MEQSTKDNGYQVKGLWMWKSNERTLTAMHLRDVLYYTRLKKEFA